MKMSDYEAVNFLVRTRKRLIKAIHDTIQMRGELESKIEHHSITIEHLTDGGFSGSLTEYKDGSGAGVDLTGCFIIKDVITSTHEILEQQLAKVERELEMRGVEVD